MWDALDPAVMLSAELSERREAGYDVTRVEPEVRSALDSGASEDIERAYRLVEETRMRADWPFDEPSSFEGIIHVLPAVPEAEGVQKSDSHPEQGKPHDLVGGSRLRFACRGGRVRGLWSPQVKRRIGVSDPYALDDTMFLGRAHSLGHARQQVEVLGWALLVNSLTLARHKHALPLAA